MRPPVESVALATVWANLSCRSTSNRFHDAPPWWRQYPKPAIESTANRMCKRKKLVSTKCISQYAGDSIEKTLVGNKCDLIDTKAVKTEQGAGLAKDVGVTFFEASAKSGVGVDKIFLETAMNIVRRQANGEVVQPDLANAPAEEEAGGKKGKGKKGKGSSRRKSNCMQQ